LRNVYVITNHINIRKKTRKIICYLEIMASALSSTVEKRKIPSENNNNGNQSKKGHCQQLYQQL